MESWAVWGQRKPWDEPRTRCHGLHLLTVFGLHSGSRWCSVKYEMMKMALCPPHFTDEKTKEGELSPSLRWHDHEVGTPDKYAKAMGMNSLLYSTHGRNPLRWSPGPKPRTHLRGHSLLPQQPEDPRVPACPPCSITGRSCHLRGHSPTRRRAAPGVNRKEPWSESKAVGTR